MQIAFNNINHRQIISPLCRLIFIAIAASFLSFDAPVDLGDKERRRRKKIVKTAEELIGSRYRSGGESRRGFDCSGFSFYVMQEHNIKLHRSSRSQARQGKQVKLKNLKPGDLVFFGNGDRINHVGIISSNQGKSLKMIHASSSRGVIEEDILQSTYWRKRIKFGRSIM